MHRAESGDLEDSPETIGRYRVLALLGRGGMGEVYLAEQREPIRRKVAIKLIKVGMDTKQVIARFEAERQALALMNHPNIARVFDVGATEQGRPYFAMEYVDGILITSYCDNQRLSTEQRLKLMIDVCEGVQHAPRRASSTAISSPRTCWSRSRPPGPFPRSSISALRRRPRID